LSKYGIISSYSWHISISTNRGLPQFW